MTLIDQLKQIPDPRHLRGRKHPLWFLLLVSLLGFLCGYRGYRPLADFCQKYQAELQQLLDLPHLQRLPSYSTFRRTFLDIPAQGWVAGFNHWSVATLPSWGQQLWSIDGKSIRATSVGGQTAAQDFTSIVSLYHQSLGVLHLALMQNRATSEIHVAQALVDNLPPLPSPQCFSLDAVHTTQGTVATITRRGHDYLLVVKQNRSQTHAAIRAIAQHQHPTSRATERDTSHRRQVTRQAQVFTPTESLRQRWQNLETVGVVHRQGWRDQHPFEETVYYLISAPWTAQQLLKASRAHWQIENGLHWVKDRTFQEDSPPQRGGFAPVHWAILNSFAITLARRQGWRTVPQALRAWANQLHQVFHFLV